MLSYASNDDTHNRVTATLGDMERRVAILVRLPEDMLAEVRQIAADEERPLNTQVLRLIRAGLEQHRAQHPKTDDKAE